MIDFVTYFNYAIAIVLTVAYLYQMGYLVIGLIRGRRQNLPEPKMLHRFAVIISARNERNVIGGLIKSLKDQNYPSELLDIYVVADNCTDDTAEVSRRAGALVYERFDTVQVGKGYALDYLFDRLKKDHRDSYEGYFVFDADNYVDPNFVREMNRVFDTGKYAAITSYRNSKNFGSNWISAGYGMWFLREARFLNAPRMFLGTSCAISGTGFLVSADLIRENGGWPYHLLTEDIEFSVNCALHGKCIGYCERAVVFDEQPVTFRQSWNQRLRWSKGFYQINFHYGFSLLKGCFQPRRQAFSCYDMLMTVAPGMLLTLIGIAFNLILLGACLFEPQSVAKQVMEITGQFLVQSVVMFYLGLLLYGAATVVVEWRSIRIPNWKKIAYLFTFPLFMFTYVPIALVALVRKVEWKPIAHGVDCAAVEDHTMV